MGLVTLGWPQFVALVLSLFGLTAVWSILFEHWITETLSRFEVRRYEQAFGFEVGLVKIVPDAWDGGSWGFARVTPGGTMYRAGVRDGDIVFNYHGYSFTELSAVLENVTKGRTSCFIVVNAVEFTKSSSREVCLEGKAQGGSINRN